MVLPGDSVQSLDGRSQRPTRHPWRFVWDWITRWPVASRDHCGQRSSVAPALVTLLLLPGVDGVSLLAQFAQHKEHQSVIDPI